MGLLGGSWCRVFQALACCLRACRSSEIARMLGVSGESVRRWKRVWEEGGADALWGRPVTGRPPKLDDAQVEQVRTALEQGAQAHGFEADLWTLERVGLVVERVAGA
ncbi:helix-turn-helix domain-containing protein [Streptomyces sp. NPDC003233]